jgi:glycosyltransferase involved in cell wall biosynthesis
MISIIISALNEEKNIAKVFNNLEIALIKFKYQYEIILINDGSKDNTKAKMEHLKRIKGSNIVFINNKINKGIGFCIKQGVKIAKYKYILFHPSDGEINAKEILKNKKYLFKKDLIIPYPINQKNSRTIFRFYLSNLYKTILRVTFLKSIKYFNGTIIFNKKIISKFNIYSDTFFIFTEIILKYTKNNTNYIEVPYRLNKRLSGKSKALCLKNLLDIIGDYLKMLKYYYL